MMQSQAFIAGTVIGREIPEDEYLKIKCVRNKAKTSVAESHAEVPPGTDPLSATR